MAEPEHPVTLSVEQLKDLNKKLSETRHDINGKLALICASIDLIRYKPETAELRLATIAEQPAKIIEALRKFSAEFEKALGITR